MSVSICHSACKIGILLTKARASNAGSPPKVVISCISGVINVTLVDDPLVVADVDVGSIDVDTGTEKSMSINKLLLLLLN